MPRVSLLVNGRSVDVEVEGRTLLVELLRDRLGLTGTHVGCDTSQCGACTVHLDGRAVKSCSVLAAACAGAAVTTIEGLADAPGLHPMQRAFHEHHGLQCGFCTPGMIMSAVAMVGRRGTDLDEHTIRAELEGNICRCTGYHHIVEAIRDGAVRMGTRAVSRCLLCGTVVVLRNGVRRHFRGTVTDRLDDVVIAGAAAEVAVELRADRALVEIGAAAVDQRHG